MYARGCRCVARAGERKTGGRRNGDIYETRRHFIDLPGDAPGTVQCSAESGPRAFPPTTTVRSGFEGSNLAAGSDEVRRRRGTKR